MNTHNNIKNPARVSCSTNPCIWRPFRPGAAPLAPGDTEHISNVTILGRSSARGEPRSLTPVRSVNANDDFGVAQTDDVAIGQLPLLYRCVIDGGAVGGVEVGQQCGLCIPADLQVTARHTGVRKAELGVLSATDDIGALAQLVGAAAAVVKLQGDRISRGTVAALAVTAVAGAGLLAVVGRLAVLGLLPVLVVAVGGLGVSALRGVTRTR